MSLLPDPDLRARCTRFLQGHGPRTARGFMQAMATAPHLESHLDEYGQGPAVQALERRVAELLGKPAALFFHKGVVAQQAALLVHAARQGRRLVALHPKCHIAIDEEDALDRLAGLVPLRIGADHRPFTAAELDRVSEPLAAVVVELPLRRAGFIATPMEELRAIAAWCRGRGVPLHLDGARIWETQPFLGVPLAEIAGLADTVYVSFYKGLGGMGGAVLAGPAEVVEQARVWRSRYGGNLFTAFPFVVTALDGLDKRLPRMADYHEHAKALAAALSEVPGIRIHPVSPHGNAFQIHLARPAAMVEQAAVHHARRTGEWLIARAVETATPGSCMAELSVGDATLDWTPAEVATAFAALVAWT